MTLETSIGDRLHKSAAGFFEVWQLPGTTNLTIFNTLGSVVAIIPTRSASNSVELPDAIAMCEALERNGRQW